MAEECEAGMIDINRRPAVAAGLDELAARPCVVFDFDGTLGDTRSSIIEVAREVLLDYGLDEAELSRVGELIGPPFPQAFSMVFGLSEQDAQTVCDRYREIYNDLGPAGWPAFPGVPDMLRDLKERGKTLVCASSKRMGLLSRCLSDEGIEPLFDVALGKMSDQAASKTDTIREALRQAGRNADEAVMVGDRHYDVEAAEPLGIPTIGVLYGGTAAPDELGKAGAVCTVDTVAELEGVLLGAER